MFRPFLEENISEKEFIVILHQPCGNNNDVFMKEPKHQLMVKYCHQEMYLYHGIQVGINDNYDDNDNDNDTNNDNDIL